jgi:hypothetical protein
MLPCCRVHEERSLFSPATHGTLLVDAGITVPRRPGVSALPLGRYNCPGRAAETRPRTFVGENTHAPLAPDLRGICSLRMRGRPAATWSSGSRSCPATQPLSTATRSADGSRPAAAARNSGLGTRALALGRPPICVGWRSLRRTSGRTALGTTALDVGRPCLGMGWRSLGVVARANPPRATAVRPVPPPEPGLCFVAAAISNAAWFPAGDRNVCRPNLVRAVDGVRSLDDLCLTD